MIDYSSMPKLRFRMSDLRPGVHVIAVCKACMASRHFLRADEFPEDIRDQELWAIEPRLRCQDRGRRGDGRVCGGRAEIEISMPRSLDLVGPCVPKTAV